MHPSKPRKPLFPESFKQPHILWWLWALPQGVLVYLNVRAYTLVVGELEEANRSDFLVWLNSQIVLAVIGVISPLLLRKLKRVVELKWCAGMFLLHLAYLWFTVVSITTNDIVPSSVQLWILPPDRLMFLQFMLVMPGLFYAGARLACFDVDALSEVKDAGIAVGVLVGTPVFVYLFVTVVMKSMDGFIGGMTETIFIIMAVSGTCLLLGALCRVMMLLAAWLQQKNGRDLLIPLMVGVVAPIAGLLLNNSIAFPFDFQTPGVYVLALVNGLLLMIPRSGQRRWDHTVWLLQTASFCYTLYFFLVFLPYLPLSLLAMIAFGAGFLILAPTALFVVHTGILRNGFIAARTDWGIVKASLSFLVALLLVPVGYTAYAKNHKRVLLDALAYVYDVNPSEVRSFDGHLPSLDATLQKMYDHKEGFELPFMTAYYNWLVYDGLVLPDKKMKHIYHMFFGRELVQKKKHEKFSNMFLGEARENGRGLRFERPGTNVELKQVSWTHTAEGSCRSLIAKVEMVGRELTQEFVTCVHVPPGVVVAGFWLHVGNERVPGRIFERKTAEWVYHMIRDTSPRDPGLLVYTQKDELELRVYPVNKEVRTVEIEFLLPDGFQAKVRVAGQSSPELQTSMLDQPRTVDVPGGGRALVLSGESDLPVVRRKPVYHFIVDRSQGTEADLAARWAAIGEWLQRFPQHAGFEIMLANFESDTGPGRIAPGETLPEPEAWSLPARGGFVPHRMIEAVMLQYATDLSGPDAGRHAHSYPHIVVLSDQDFANDPGIEHQYFAELVPEMPGYDLVASQQTARRLEFGGYQRDSNTPFLQDVHLFKAGSVFRAAPADRPAVVQFPDVNQELPLQVWNENRDIWQPVDGLPKLEKDGRFAAGSGAWMNYLQSILQPSGKGTKLAEMVARSRESRVLLPNTSYMVVENSAQWEILKRKEKQKLSNHEELEFMETPEPPWWVLIIGYLAFRRWRAGRPC